MLGGMIFRNKVEKKIKICLIIMVRISFLAKKKENTE